MLIANSTRFLRASLYDELRKQPGLVVIGEVCEQDAIVAATERTDPDCVIVPLDDPAMPIPICTEMLAKRPRLRIVAIGEGTNIVAIYWKSDGEVRCSYATASREGILKAIRYPAS